MRKLEYLSPTSFSLWKKDKEAFYIRYLSEQRAPREPQNEPMALGAYVDALIKNYLHERIYGKTEDDRFGIENIINAQVEEHNRERIRDHANYVFEQYRSSGALIDLMTEVSKGSGLRMEFDLKGVVNGYRIGVEGKLGSITLLGKPDLSFITHDGIHVILDWKVNGYFSKYNTSPLKGYVRLRTAGNTTHSMHRGSHYGYHGGIMINISNTLDELHQDWACQLACYSWLTGSPVGSEEFVVGIDQIIGNGGVGGQVLPTIKVAEHRLKINGEYQKQLFNQMVECWETIQSGWIFRDMSENDSKNRCEMIDNMNQNGPDPFLEELLR